jgi:phage tail-like protein
MPLPSPQPLPASSFVVLIEDQEVGFSEVGPLSSYTDPSTSDARPGHLYARVVMRRALTGSHELFDWRREITDGKRDHRDVTIHQLAGPGGEIVNTWRLVRAWPIRWSGPSFNAQGNDVALEEIELAFEDLLWLSADGAEDSSA